MSASNVESMGRASTPPSGHVTEHDREIMRRIGAALAERWGQPHGMTLKEVCDEVDRLNRTIPAFHDDETERELDLLAHWRVHQAMQRKQAEWNE